MATAVAQLPAVRPPPPPTVSSGFDELEDAEMDNLLSAIDEKKLEQAEMGEPTAYLAYYKYLLPWKQLFLWLNRTYTIPTSSTSTTSSATASTSGQASRNFTHREFAFTLQNEAYLRYNSFGSPEDLKREVCRLNPARFEIGPIYSAKPKDRKTVQKTLFKPVSRELVFDIDMTDYDEIRTCCTGKGICKRCWAFISVAVKVLDEMIRDDFGFKHLLWVYSGRRGIHCWISDEEACALTDDARRAIIGWVDIIKGSANTTKKVDVGGYVPNGQGNNSNGRSLHPSLRRALEGNDGQGPLKMAFVDVILRDQDCFKEKKQWETLLNLLPTSELEAITKLRAKWSTHPFRPSLDKWSDVTEAAAKSKKQGIWKTALEDVILQYTYPRVDTEVSKHLNHLLKSPFVIHPATGKVCVPLTVTQVEKFDPDRDCPSISQLLREMHVATQKSGIDLHKEKGQMSSMRAFWDQTSLKPFVETMDKHVKAIMQDLRQAKKEKDAKSFDF
jgi:DNA primase small subunit